jgi:hypothetical protein
MIETITRLAPVRAATLGPPTSADDATHTVQVCWLSSPDVERCGWDGSNFIERLPFANCDLSRLASGAAPVTDSHQREPIAAQIGVVKKAWIENGTGLADLQISDRPELAGLWADIKGGIVRSVSIETEVNGWVETPATQTNLRTRTAASWKPLAISFVSVPADPGAVTRSQQTPNKEIYMEPTTIQTVTGIEQPVSTITRAAEVADIRRRTAPFIKSLPAGFVDGLIARGIGPNEATSAALEQLAANYDATRIDGNNPGVTGGVVTRDHEDGAFEGMRDALVLRSQPGYKACDRAREFAVMSLVDIARDRLRASGAAIPWTRSEIVTRAMTTSDFPNLLQSTGDRTLRHAYEAAPAGVLQVARQSTARDFRAVNRLQLSEAPTLEKVNEAGEYTHGAMAEAKASYSLATFGRIVSLSRQSIVNDDLQAFQSLMAKMGFAAREFEATQLVGLLTANANMADGVALFHATHGNLGIGAPSALSVAGLTLGRKAMRLQKGLAGIAINATPRWLVVPASLETVGEQTLTQLFAVAWDATNPFPNSGLSLVIDPRLDAVSATAWYLATDAGQLEHLEYSYLESQQGPRLEARWGFEVDALETRISLDFGCGVVDFRGLYKSNGV